MSQAFNAAAIPADDRLEIDPAAKELPVEQFSFTGTGGEYFRIWVVNMLLMIVTLGIYSAWAKVRKLKYFYGSTRVAGSSFDYHGEPLSILKGRLIAAALLLISQVFSDYSLTASIVMTVLLALASPWLLWKSLQFKFYNSSYRGIRFGFAGNARKAYMMYLLLPVLSLLTFGLLAPLAHQRIKNFQHSEGRFGMTRFSFEASIGAFYKSYLAALAVLLIGSGLIFLGVSMAMGCSMQGYLGSPNFQCTETNLAASLGLFSLTLYAWLMLIFPLFFTMIQNLVWNGTAICGHRFRSEMKWGRMAFIMFTNLLLTILTCGLFAPFAQVRTMKYRVESMSLLPAGDLGNFTAGAVARVSAGGEGMADLMDFDVSL